MPIAESSLVYHRDNAAYSLNDRRNISPIDGNGSDVIPRFFMAFDGGQLSTSARLRQALIDQLELAIDLIGRLDDELYSASKDGCGTVGAHLRHNINFVEAILDGAMSGVIDYATRTRDRRIETERSFASWKLRSMIEALEKVPMDLAEPMTVISEIDPKLRHRSTLGRELEFVVSHTVHHFALIKERLEGDGIEFDKRLGVAPSTLEYWKASGQ